MGGLLGGPKGMCPPHSKIIGAGGGGGGGGAPPTSSYDYASLALI